MTRRAANESGPGLYLNIRSGEFIEHGGGLLPGSSRDRYLRIPLPFMIILGPLLGGLYVLVLPLVGAAAAIYLLARWAYKSFLSLSMALLCQLIVPTWMPGRSYLLGLRSRRKKAVESKESESESEMEDLALEIEEKLKRERRG